MVILELIHAQIPDARKVAFIRFNHHMVNHSNLADRVNTWQIIQVSALSAFDGSVLDYHGSHG